MTQPEIHLPTIMVAKNPEKWLQFRDILMCSAECIVLVLYCFSFLSKIPTELWIKLWKAYQVIDLLICQIWFQNFFEKISLKTYSKQTFLIIFATLSCIQIILFLSQTCLAVLDWTFSALFYSCKWIWKSRLAKKKYRENSGKVG